MLMQKGHPLAYLSKALGLVAQTMSTYEKECLAILLVVYKWRLYLHYAPFTIITDHRSLVHLSDQKLTIDMQQKAFVKLMGLQYKLVYRKDNKNYAADVLSRLPADHELYAISLCRPHRLKSIVEGYTADARDTTLLRELNIIGSNSHGYNLQNVLIRYKGRLWLGNNKEAHQAILLSLHISGIGGHSAFLGTYQRIKALFSWPKMKDDAKKYVQQCTICQQAKAEHVKILELLSPFPIPIEAWSTISMDFIEGLPKFGDFDCIFVIIDKLTKYGHFIPLSHPFIALTVLQKYMDTVYCLHGLIISDRDPILQASCSRSSFACPTQS
jgi:hypothetical protein